MTAATGRPAFSRRRRLRLSAALAALVATLVPAVWAAGAAAAAPEGRGYEMVSPADKNFGDLSVGSQYFSDIAAAPTGETASFCASTAFEGAHLGVVCADYVSMRDAADRRWETAPVSPPYCTINHGDPDHVFFRHDRWQQGSSVDMRRVVSALPEGGGGCPFEPLDPFAPTPSLNLYMFEAGNLASGRLVTPEPGVPGFEGRLNTYAGTYRGGSEDLSHVVFESTGQQTPEVPADGQLRLFEWVDGNVRLVTRDTDNVPFATESHLATGWALWGASDRFNAVSSDGSRIFFVTPTGASPTNDPPSGEAEIYMRENGAATYHVSGSECTSACGSATGNARFRYATPDGGKVLFTSPKRLTDDPTPSGVNLYMYTHSDDPASDQNLTLLTRDNEPADGTQTTPELSPNAIGVLGIGDDGDDVYFVADGQLVPGGPTDTPFGINLYRWQANGGNPELSYIGLLASGDAFVNWNDGDRQNPDLLVTPDGEHLLLETNATLDPVADSQGPGESPRDVYRWSEDDGWDCISCPAAGGPNGGFLYDFIDQAPTPHTIRGRRPISDDGRRVFFNSDIGLVPRDTNGVRDVYMWEDGTVSLVSSGKDPSKSLWIGASADGDDVFFTTRERLVGWDVDGNADLYEARVGGGFPEPPASPAPCTGEECQNRPAGPPAAPGSGSADFNGSGNVGAGARSSISVQGLSAAARSALATGAKARLRLKVNRAGRVTVVGRAKVGKRRGRVVSSSAQARKAGAVRVPFGLSKGARAELRRRGSLRVTLTVRFRDARPQELTFTVKSASSKRGRR